MKRFAAIVLASIMVLENPIAVSAQELNTGLQQMWMQI